MEILILRPPIDLQNGNLATALQWQDTLSSLGHKVRVTTENDGLPVDLLIRLHATKTSSAAATIRREHPDVPTIVALTGTDLYPELTEEALVSLQDADHIVVLQAGALERLPAHLRPRTHLVPLRISATTSARLAPSPEAAFRVAVIGHLRAIKDPLRTAEASRLLPPKSRISIQHIGALLDPAYEALVRREAKENARYRWLGPLPYEETLAHLRAAHLFVLTSESEGAGHTLREAMGADLPILSSRMDASESLLGTDYPGLFPVGDTSRLASLLQQCEEDPGFLHELTDRLHHQLKGHSGTEQKHAWEQLLLECTPRTC